MARSRPPATGPSATSRPDRRRRRSRSSPADRRTPSPPTDAPNAPTRPARPTGPRPNTSRRWPPTPPPDAHRPAPSPTPTRTDHSRSAPRPNAHPNRSSGQSPTAVGADRYPRTADRHTLRSQGASFVEPDVNNSRITRVSTRSGGPAPSSHQCRMILIAVSRVSLMLRFGEVSSGPRHPQLVPLCPRRPTRCHGRDGGPAVLELLGRRRRHAALLRRRHRLCRQTRSPAGPCRARTRLTEGEPHRTSRGGGAAPTPPGPAAVRSSELSTTEFRPSP